MRVLFFGSRWWTNRDKIHMDLARLNPEEDIIVHGACPPRVNRSGKSYPGADALADDEAKRMGFTVEPHPADWSLGRKAGPLRNQEMLDSGIDLAFGYKLTNVKTKGTDDMKKRLEDAGVLVRMREGKW